MDLGARACSNTLGEADDVGVDKGRLAEVGINTHGCWKDDARL